MPPTSCRLWIEMSIISCPHVAWPGLKMLKLFACVLPQDLRFLARENNPIIFSLGSRQLKKPNLFPRRDQCNTFKDHVKLTE